MLGKSTLVAFVATTNGERARHFYGDVLGLPIVEDGPYALVCDANGVSLRIQKVGALKPQGFTALGWDVPDIQAAVDALVGRGVAFERYDFLEQDERAIWQSPSGARVAWFKDPDGNVLSLSEP